MIPVERLHCRSVTGKNCLAGMGDFSRIHMLTGKLKDTVASNTGITGRLGFANPWNRSLWENRPGPSFALRVCIQEVYARSL